MTPSGSHPETLKRRFQEAIELSPERRAAYVAAVACEDPGLHAPLLTLLRAHDDAALFLSEPTRLSTPTRVEGSAGDASGERLFEEAPGEQVGPFELVDVLGEGGFAVVWRARQTHPVSRHVALKILKPGMDSRQVLARFEAERQTLAMLAHPSIACVLDAGTTPRGRPYFAMELVVGEPVTAFCDASRLPVPDRLRLFISVCLAVEHAHQKGIIHRDLKPSNILVSLVDGRPLPVVIDFGIAKAVEDGGGAANAITEARQIVGTPQYMSPEQAGLGGAGVDTRTDVYSLGILLYELLAGVSPYDVAALRGAGVAEVARIVRDTRMSRPSTRFMSLGAARATVAVNRRSDERSLARQLRGDLDWIVLRATAKEPDARYPTASALAQDVASHLADRAVSAGPPSRVYQARKFVRRHRVAVASAGVALTAIVAGLVLALVGLRQANEMRGVVEDALRVATGRLWDSYMAQARANREGAKPGRRATALEAVRDAAAIRVTIGVRNEAIAALALDDVDFLPGPIIPGGVASAWGLLSAAYVVCPEAPGVARVVRTDNAAEVFRVGEHGAAYSHGVFSADATLFAAVLRTPGGARTHVRQLPGGMLVGAFAAGGGDAGGIRVGRRADGAVWLAVTSDDGTVSVRTTRSEAPLVEIAPGGADAYARLDASPDARCIAVVRSTSQRVEAWSADSTARRLWDVALPAAPVSVGVAPDASMVAVGLEDRSVLVLDASSGSTLTSVRGHQGLPVRLAFIDAGRVLATWAWDNTIRFWDVQTALPIFGPIEGWTPANLGDEFSAVSGERLATWRFARSRVYQRLLVDAPFGVNSECAFAADGRSLVTAGRNGVHVLDAASGRLVRTIHDSPANALTLVGDGTLILAPVEAGVLAWPLPDVPGKPNGPPREVLRTGPVGQVWVAPVPGPPHDRAVVVSPDGINVVLLDRGRVQRRLPPYPGLAERPDMTRDGRWLFTGNWRGHAGYVWDMSTGERVLAIEAGHVVGRFSARGDALVVGTPDRFICYDVPSWRERWTAERERPDTLAGVIAHAPDGSFVAVGHTRFQLRLLDPATGDELATLRSPDMHELNDAAVSPDARTIMCTTVDRVVQRWRLDVLLDALRGLGEGMDFLPAAP